MTALDYSSVLMICLSLKQWLTATQLQQRLNTDEVKPMQYCHLHLKKTDWVIIKD